ncbi:MAG: hypothetical protein ACRC5V_01775 [Aeromonas sp.]
MFLTRCQLISARRWLPLWSLLLVLMSFGSRAATDLCTLTTHCSESARTLEKAMPCGSFTTALSMTLVGSNPLTVAVQAPDTPEFSSPSLYIPDAPRERLERPPRTQI